LIVVKLGSKSGTFLIVIMGFTARSRWEELLIIPILKIFILIGLLRVISIRIPLGALVIWGILIMVGLVKLALGLAKFVTLLLTMTVSVAWRTIRMTPLP
jgi:hypothetical protein